MIIMSKKTTPRKLDYEITVLEKPNSHIAEAYRKIPLDIKFSSIDKEVQVIQIASAISGEHKTTTTVNLAATYVELGKKVLVIDADLRKPKIHHAFQLLNDEGLTDYLVDKITKENLIHSTPLGIDIITSGPQVPLPHIVLGSEKFKQLIKELRQTYDIILIDCPPVLVATDNIIVSSSCDKTLFVLNQSKAKKVEVLEAIRMLKKAGIDIAGIIVTGISRNSRGYNYSYDYYYKAYRED